MRVLQGFPAGRATTNPYLVMLAASLRREPGITVVNFDWRTALCGRFDLYHTHWPENLGTGRSRPKSAVRQLLTALFLLRLAVLRRPIVRTVHNVGLPSGLSRTQRFLLSWIDRQTAMRIRLNDITPIEGGKPVATIPHGDYRGWFDGMARSEARPGHLAFVGLVRSYKGIDLLLSAFTQTRGAPEKLSLAISGNPTSSEIAEQLTSMAADDDRVRLDFRFLTDPELVARITEAELVVLPYRFMHNSGGALAALSLARPILVPDNELNRRLSREVGEGWVHFFTGDISAAAILEAVRSLRAHPPVGEPRFEGRGWDSTGAEHVAAYLNALGPAGQRNRGTSKSADRP